MSDQARRQAANEAVMREVNERVAELDRNAVVTWAEDGELFDFVCECCREVRRRRPARRSLALVVCGDAERAAYSTGARERSYTRASNERRPR